MYYFRSSAIALLLLSSLLSAPCLDAVDTLKVRKPEWMHEIRSTYEDGNTREVLLYETKDGTQLPQKIVQYYPNGALRQESDIRPNFVREGVTVSFYEDGTLAKTENYKNNKLEGTVQEFYPSGKLKSSQEWLAGILHGDSKEFFENGKQISLTPYTNGLIQGNCFEWDDTGVLRVKAHYLQGMLHDEKGEAAVNKYFPNSVVQEKSHFSYGLQHGMAVGYNEAGKECYQVQFIHGKKEGLELKKSDNGDVLAEGQWQQGVPIGRHFRNHPNGKQAFIAIYDSKGVLQEPIKEFSDAGRLIAEYGCKDGSRKEWYPNGALKRDLHFAQDEFDGVQKQYYPSGKLYISAEFTKGVLDGVYEEWHENEKISLRYTFKNGLKEGKCQRWYANGQPKEETYYQAGIPEGVQKWWCQNGKLQEELTWKNKELHGQHVLFDDKGEEKLLLKEEYAFGAPIGTWKEWYLNGKRKSKKMYKPEGAILDGEYLSWFEDGSPHEVCTYTNGQPEGEWTEYFPVSTRQKKQIVKALQHYENGKLHGEQRSFWENSQLQALLTYDKGVLNGRKALFSEEGTRLFDVTYVQAKLEGKVYQLHPDGMEEIQYFKNNILDGDHIIYYPSQKGLGKLKAYEAHYVKGKLEGEVVEYNANGGKTVSTLYKDGLREGIATFYNDDGRVAMTAEFKNGKQYGMMRHFFPNGSVAKESRYVDDLQEGDELTFFENGKKASQKQYKNGKLNGVTKEWNEKGICIFEAEYKNGLRQGKFNKYDNAGNPYVLQTFDKDHLVNKKTLGKS
ncbi:MAG: hypothetical protein JWO53_960 [Chlamydiia bacterium]|nr:hypothetical protein [Chlamydiia bacterium]